eukprot:363276-Chlamydomonas_euryale.AAC.8
MSVPTRLNLLCQACAAGLLFTCVHERGKTQPFINDALSDALCNVAVSGHCNNQIGLSAVAKKGVARLNNLILSLLDARLASLRCSLRCAQYIAWAAGHCVVFYCVCVG